MIKLQEYTPRVYYNQSRDFQFIGRLYDIVLNSVKTNADMLYQLPCGDNLNTQLLDLLSLTLGFKASHEYNIIQLEAVCKVLPILIKNKGNIKSLNLLISTLLSAEGITLRAAYQVQDNTISLFIPATLTDVTLLRDLLPYLLPAGIACNIYKNTAIKANVLTKVNTSAIAHYEKVSDALNATLVNKETKNIYSATIKEGQLYKTTLSGKGFMPSTTVGTKLSEDDYEQFKKTDKETEEN